MSYLFTLDYQLQAWGKVMQDLLMLHLNHLHYVTLPFSDRGKVRNDNVLDASLSTSILCWGPATVARISPHSLSPPLVTFLAVSYSLASPLIFACR